MKKTILLLFVGVIAASRWASGPLAQSSNQTPQPRAGHALVYDSARRAVLLVNGDHRATGEGEVWQWTGTNWNLIDTSGPPPRTLAGVAYDAAHNTLVMQGGLGSGDTVFADTMLWQGSQWRTASGPGPGIRNHHAMAYDAARGKVVLFGGQDQNINLQGDTWEWDGVSWSRVATSGPSARVHHALVYDGARNKVLLFGGSDGRSDLADLWEWTGTIWRQINAQGPSPRSGHRMAFHAGQGKVYLVGGHQTDDSVWMWNGSAWAQFQGTTPSARGVHALAYDEARQRLVLFGGYSFPTNQNLNDTWELIDNRWVRVDTTPTPTPTPTATPTPSPTPTQRPIQLLLEESALDSNQAVALESVSNLRDPFAVSVSNSLYPANDRNTRVMVFVSNLLLAPGEAPAAVIVNLVDSNRQSFDVVAEEVRPVANFDFDQVTFRLPDNLSAGTCDLTIKAGSRVSNSGVIRISA